MLAAWQPGIPGGNKVAVAVKQLETVIIHISHIDPSSAVHRHIIGKEKLPVAGAITPQVFKVAVGVELLDPVIVGIRHEDVPLAIHRHTPGPVKICRHRSLNSPQPT